MKLSFYRTTYQVHIEGEDSLSTTSFLVGSHGVWEIESTPMGIVVARDEIERSGNKLPVADILLTATGFGLLKEKRQKPAVQKKSANASQAAVAASAKGPNNVPR